jgi:anti-anti-sigma factor
MFLGGNLMNITKEQLNGLLKLKIEGDMTIQNAEAIKSAFIELINNAVNLDLSISSTTDIDVSGLQLLCSVHRTLKKLNKNFIISTPIPETLKEIIKTAGYYKSKGCFTDDNKICPIQGVLHV